jgi:hypothetical protein
MARVHIVKPFVILSMMTLSMVTGGIRLASNNNHWEDVLVGFALGAAIATYLVMRQRETRTSYRCECFIYSSSCHVAFDCLR